MIEPARAPVVPRVVCRRSGNVVRLEDEIQRLLDLSESITVQLDGDGASSALAHLAAVFADSIRAQKLVLDDDASDADSVQAIVVVRTSHESRCDVSLRLAAWTRDDFIEYLLAVHSHRCASVMRRLADANQQFASGSPSVWRLILDRMASDESQSDIEAIVLDELDSRFANPVLADTFADELIIPVPRNEVGYFGHLGSGTNAAADDVSNIFYSREHSSARQLLSHEDVRQTFAMRRFIRRLTTSTEVDFRYLMSGLASWEVLVRIAKRVRELPPIQIKLQRLFDASNTLSTTNCATVLSQVDPRWRPNGKRLRLYRTYCPNVVWPDLDLSFSDLRNSCFTGADLSRAKLSGARLSGADFSDAILRHADFRNASSETPSSQPANMLDRIKRKLHRHRDSEQPARRIANQATMETHWRTVFVQADLSHADLSGCHFQHANFSRANMTKTEMRQASFHQADFTDADLRDANLTGSTLVDVDLGGAVLDRCVMSDIQAQPGLNFENLRATSVQFRAAKLPRSDWTESTLSECCFAGAILSEARLALIHWVDCDLSGADLRRCDFHLGSTRCGLVGSPYPSHGTRTGFYTDEYDEQYFQSPETIRKACLMNADLRGANIDGVDFYLVDLRGAKFDLGQRSQLRVTGAILDDDG